MRGLSTGSDVLKTNPLQFLEDWNRTLTEKVRHQVDLIERMSRLKRYVSPQLAETVLKSDDTDVFKCHRREITAIFLDLRGFTAFSDHAKPDRKNSTQRTQSHKGFE